MNDQLNRPKNKGMSNSKIHAFLMCPTSRPTHLGGTPLESGEAGGHIKKASWVHVLDALPLALRLPCEITRFKMQQFSAGEAAANAGFIDRLATVSSFGTEIAELGGGEHLGNRFKNVTRIHRSHTGCVGGFGVVGLVVVQVAPLAPCAEVGAVAVLGRVVKVRNSQNDLGAGFRMRRTVDGAAIGKIGATLAPITSGLANGNTDGLPVLRITRFVFGADGHESGLLLGRKDVQNAVKTPFISLELSARHALNVQLALVGNSSARHPVADGALSDASSLRRKSLVRVEVSKFFRAHAEIMALAIWVSP